MINFLNNWWQLEKIKQAIRRQNFSHAEKLIRFRQQQKIKLSLLEQLFLQNINLQETIEEKNRRNRSEFRGSESVKEISTNSEY